MGKTRLALNIAEHVGPRAAPVALFSLEMSKDEIAQRLMCSVGKVDSSRLRSGELGDGEWPRADRRRRRSPARRIYIDDTGGITVMEMQGQGAPAEGAHPAGWR